MEINAQNDRVIKNQKSRLILKLIRPSLPPEKPKAVAKIESSEAYELIENIRNARKEWLNANSSFEYANEKEMVDYYTYKIKACEVRYEYLIRKAKEKGIKVDLLEIKDMTNSLNESSF